MNSTEIVLLPFGTALAQLGGGEDEGAAARQAVGAAEHSPGWEVVAGIAAEADDTATAEGGEEQHGRRDNANGTGAGTGATQTG